MCAGPPLPFTAASFDPSAEEQMSINRLVEKTLVTQVCPPLVETQISRPPAERVRPSAEDATASEPSIPSPGAALEDQFAPEFVLMKSWLPVVPAINREPSADDATDFQFKMGILFEVQVVPPSAEV